ncbi:RNA polymerase sigma factor [Bacillus shivajii]|uniref:RNA polymerase sigma factor n=1 Tax=Bacillus shivajii TaxID=1983719 RepID=UPI001CFABC06|nr:RNA polymerase sigma factor [Bacillus shivajii]UCZ51400.1 RNA polymerase sigma factor [Bacillus shivajii]
MSRTETITNWFEKYSDDIYNFLIYYTGSTDVEDYVQEVFIKALRNYHSFKGDSNPKTWLFSIARNVAVDEMRKRKKETKKQQKSMKQKKESSLKTPEEVYQLNESKKELYQIIRTLKSNYRDVLILRGIKEFTVQETAEILNWTENKVKVTYHRALKAVEKKLRRSDA